MAFANWSETKENLKSILKRHYFDNFKFKLTKFFFVKLKNVIRII